MSNDYLKLVRKLDTKAPARPVLVVLADRADEKGVCWPGISTIAKESGFSRSTVKKALAALRKDGLISWTHRRDGGGGLSSSRYTLTLPRATPDLPLGRELTDTGAGDGQKASVEASIRSKECFDLKIPHGRNFANSWNRWKTHRKEMKKPLTPTSEAAMLKKLATYSEAEAVAMIDHTIEKGGQGLFAPTTTSLSTPANLYDIYKI